MDVETVGPLEAICRVLIVYAFRWDKELPFYRRKKVHVALPNWNKNKNKTDSLILTLCLLAVSADYKQFGPIYGKLHWSCWPAPGLKKSFSVLNSTEHEIYAQKC